MWHCAYMARSHPTQSEIAERIGRDRSYVSKILRGARQPSLATAVKLFQEFGIKVGPIKDKHDKDIADLSRILVDAHCGAPSDEQAA